MIYVGQFLTPRVLTHTPTSRIDRRFALAKAIASVVLLRCCTVPMCCKSTKVAHRSTYDMCAVACTCQLHRPRLCVDQCSWPVLRETAACVQWRVRTHTLTYARTYIHMRFENCAVQPGLWTANDGMLHYIR